MTATSNGGLPRRELLTQIMVYWATESIGTSFLPYFDSQTRAHDLDQGRNKGMGRVLENAVSLWTVSQGYQPTTARMGGSFLQCERWTTMPSGGHFAAMEENGIAGSTYRCL